ncbi:hypothetical protein GGR51DRAFT_558503 [Nemania sp. FL0031]|nr:hypothetical protein GGR51DRAFT_558503 [Nemania sp. FL0031]
MSTTDKEPRPTSYPEAASSAAAKRKLFKGTLSPPCTQSPGKSYTLTPPLSSEVFIKDTTGKKRYCSTAISSMAVPQPFVDPAVLQRRPPHS